MATPLPLPAVIVTPGVMLEPPSGFYAYNFSPTLNSPDNNEIYDPNFIPGFHVGLTNVSLSYSSGQGYARIGYSIGPWQHLEVALPHMAVGPQCCNFIEVPRTQQFRALDWGDYYYVRAGFESPAVNVPNYTADFTTPAYVGLRTDWHWVVSISFDWKPPKLLDPKNEWATLGIVTTQYVPTAPKKLVYTVVNFWMDPNSTSVLSELPHTASNGTVAGSREVIYPAIQLSAANGGNQTITLELSSYLQDTLNTLGFTNATGDQPVISYVYLNIEGYNVQWNTTLYSFFVMSDQNPSGPVPANNNLSYVAGVAVLSAAVIIILYFKRKSLLSR
jgi:hypothetical protein